MSVPVSPKKRKQPDNVESIGGEYSKRPRSDQGRPKEKKSKKGKSKASPEGEFKLVKASIAVSIPPLFSNDAMRGVLEMLDSLVMRYVPALNGVLLCHSNAQFLSSVAMIKGDCPFANCNVSFDATIWSPQIGMKICGRINLCSPDHISLLLHKTFNVAIPRHHIQTESWAFEYGPAENDPEYGPDAMQSAAELDRDSTLVDDGKLDKGILGVDNEGGMWVHKVTGERLGGQDGILEFTVIELKMANQMLSLVGSLQEDPFSPEHVPLPVVMQQTNPTEEAEVDYQDTAMGSDDDDNAFDALKKMGERIITEETEVMEKVSAVIQTKKKKKKKDEAEEKKPKKKRKASKGEE